MGTEPASAERGRFVYFGESDRPRLDAGVEDRHPVVSRYGRALADLLDVMKARGREAESAPKPRDKVVNLELAKLALRELEDCIVPDAGVQLVGLAEARSWLNRLEQTYRAFGYYRLVGIR